MNHDKRTSRNPVTRRAKPAAAAPRSTESVQATGVDTDAIHQSVAGEIAGLTAKATPTTSDQILIEDADDTNSKKRADFPVGVTDHGALSGLGDDDHSQYLLVNGSRELINVLRFGATGTPAIRMKSVFLPTDDEWLVGNEGETLYVAYRDDSAASLSRRLVFYPAPDSGSGTDGDIVFNDLSGAVALHWDESDGRWEFAARPYSTADTALLEVVGHSHTTMADIGTNTHADIDTHISNEPAAAIATHAADASAHHAKYADADAVSAMGAKGDANALNHDRYTDAEVDTRIGLADLADLATQPHSALTGVATDDHHTKYTDAEAATQADTQIAAAAVGDLSDVTEWTTWSPSYTNLTVGNGTVVARYTKIGKTVICDFTFTLGSTSAIGTNPTVSLPASATTAYTFNRNSVGNTYIRDNGAATYYGSTYLPSATAMSALVQNSSGTYLSGSLITASVPMTWATGDILYMRATYEAA